MRLQRAKLNRCQVAIFQLGKYCSPGPYSAVLALDIIRPPQRVSFKYITSIPIQSTSVNILITIESKRNKIYIKTSTTYTRGQVSHKNPVSISAIESLPQAREIQNQYYNGLSSNSYIYICRMRASGAIFWYLTLDWVAQSLST